MVIFAIAMPLVVLVILGIVYGAKPAFTGASYTFLEQSFGGLATIAIAAGGVMGLPLAVSDYRGKQILKRYHVTPIHPGLILFTEVSMYFIYCVASLVTLLITASLCFGVRIRGNIGLFLLGWIYVMFCIFSIGMMVGGIAKDSKTAGIIASLLYFPMLVFSGATLPYEVMPKGLQYVVDVLPLTQGIKLLKNATLGVPMDQSVVSIVVLAGFSVVCCFVAVKFFRWETA